VRGNNAQQGLFAVGRIGEQSSVRGKVMRCLGKHRRVQRKKRIKDRENASKGEGGDKFLFIRAASPNQKEKYKRSGEGLANTRTGCFLQGTRKKADFNG